MDVILNFSHAFFGWLWRASWQASVVIVLVLLAQWLLRKELAPRWRHGLWLLVLLRLILPGSIQSPISVFNWVRAEPAQLANALVATPAHDSATEGSSSFEAAPGPASPSMGRNWSRSTVGMVWLAGALLIPLYLAISACRLGWKVRRHRPVTNGSILDLLEDCKLAMGVRTPLTLVETSVVRCPALFGFIRPRLLLPAGLLQSFSLPELRYVFLHELAHLKRGDIPANWLTIAPLTLHWFNPLVWYGFRRMRADAELACDALALSRMQAPENKQYGATIIKLLETFSRPAVAPGLVGILENQNLMKRRISMIASFSKNRGLPVIASALFIALGALTLTDAQKGNAADTAAAVDAGGPPRIVATTPTVGETDVDPGLKEITVTFDRDMAGGFSWTGGGSDYPPGQEGQKPRWIDKRTCAMPVKLQGARYYRVGINSTSYQNFRSADGVPVRPSAIYFTTKGASEELKRKATKPVIVELIPKNGAKDVDPNLKELRVTFNVPMGGGFSWTGGGPEYPTTPEGKKPSWTADKKTCVLPVQLESGKDYRLGLNSPSHKNFQSAGGVPLDPVVLTFRTRN